MLFACVHTGGGDDPHAQGHLGKVHLATPPWTFGRNVGPPPPTPPWTFAGKGGGGGGTFKVHLTKVPSQGTLVRWYVAI